VLLQPQSPRHLEPAKLRRKKVGGHQEKHYVRRAKAPFDDWSESFAGKDLAVVPFFDQSGSALRIQARRQSDTEFPVLAAVTVE
jgi:hypothetical protein